ncbi:MAG: nucleotide exchange factor GrpE [Thermodesulfobacteriaceae bacterium]|nr:nucleotide exchange factor GrpE [Thermodesulfobacteriaceae bacterium]MDW8135383.1 nucleotide exchange factor GrpE [Thermodesulfobacterium sp.]
MGEAEFFKESSEVKEVSETVAEVSLEEKIKHMEQELKEWKDKALRYAAEVENLKKSFKREKEEYYKFALETVFKELLPSIDNLERALEAFENSSNIEALREGVYLSLKVIYQTLEKFGLKQFAPAIGDSFHPHYHEALATDFHPEVPDGGIIKVYQKGYKLHDRVLRPALVCVCMSKKEERPLEDYKSENQDFPDE